jgi:large subunit ribosomal protein L20
MRVKSNVARHRRKNRIRKTARGAYGGRSKLLRTAIENNMRAMRNAYIGRKERKRVFRRLWIERINAAVRQRGMTYSEFMGAMGRASIEMDRKSLADLAVTDSAAFDRLVETVRSA